MLKKCANKHKRYITGTDNDNKTHNLLAKGTTEWVGILLLPCMSCPTMYLLLCIVAVCYNFTTTIHTQTNTHAQRGSSKAPRAGDREQQEGEEGYR